MGTLDALARRWPTTVATASLVLMMSAPVVTSATPPCRVRNVTQDTTGRSLVRMVKRARDGDRLRVRGTCPGEVVIDADILISGRDGAILTGRGRTRVVLVRQGSTVTLADLIIQRGRRDLGAGVQNNGTPASSSIALRRPPA